jgi:hypothetical protein
MTGITLSPSRYSVVWKPVSRAWSEMATSWFDTPARLARASLMRTSSLGTRGPQSSSMKRAPGTSCSRSFTRPTTAKSSSIDSPEIRISTGALTGGPRRRGWMVWFTSGKRVSQKVSSSGMIRSMYFRLVAFTIRNA